MSEIQKMVYTDENNEKYEFFIETNLVDIPEDEEEDERAGKGVQTTVQMQKAARMIRGYAIYAVSAFKNFSTAKVEEVTLSFGLKIGGKVGIPYITEGSTESNLAIQVKCSFPDQES